MFLFRIIKIVFFSFFMIPAFAQIGGISGAKLSIPNFATVHVGIFEFEPSFSVFSAREKFNNTNKTESLNGVIKISDLVFRVTTGLTDNIETGISLSTQMKRVNWGLKYSFYNSNQFNFFFLGGISLSAGNYFIPDSSSGKETTLFSLGSGISAGFNEKLSTDFMLVLSKNSDGKTLINTGVSNGYFLNDKLQLICEFTGEYNNLEDSGACKISVLSGLTYHVSDRLIIILGTQYDLAGKNYLKSFGYFGAFTISL